MEKRYALRARGFDLAKTARRVAEVLGGKQMAEETTGFPYCGSLPFQLFFAAQPLPAFK
ncbi:MAG: hypothetical protein JSV40_03585 [Deltaproteobacteria bacterium]|nr:MAG: hypothetical protein JSV40_03585 [Deltaproteobacteria bacterium]